MRKSHAYIFVHDQDIIHKYEDTRKFWKIFGSDFTYVFVGMKPTDALNIQNVIICRDLECNIERYNKLVSYTGWYALVKNHLLTHEYNIMLEYDVILSQKFDQVVTQFVKQSRSKDVFSFIPVPKDFRFYEYMNEFFSYMGIEGFPVRREQYIERHKREKWMGSSNSIWTRERLIDFVDWFSTVLDTEFMTYPYIGHTVERAITAYCVLNDIKYNFITGVLRHFYLDSHETQAEHNNGNQKQYKDYIKELSSK
ncbi:MAG: hypothetical protein LLG93_11720 [Deltaproteobacteria bacterium]|nr:hypothetical protein [Deltaproteobacteria bacterium]